MHVAHLLSIGALGLYSKPRLPGGLGRGAQLRQLLAQGRVLGATGTRRAARLLSGILRCASLGEGGGVSLRAHRFA